MTILTLDQVRNMLRVNKHRLDDELEIQPDMMQRIAEQVVIKNSRALEAKEDLGVVEARLTEDEKGDDPKLTKDQVEARVKRHADRTRAWQKYQQARSDYENWNYVLECWRQKGFSLKELANLYAAQYFSVDSVSARARDDGLIDRQAAMRAVRDRAQEPAENTPRRRAVLP